MTLADTEIAPEIDPLSVLRSLGFVVAGEIVRIRGGWDTLIWRFETPDGSRHALRLHILPEREDMARREPGGLPADGGDGDRCGRRDCGGA